MRETHHGSVIIRRDRVGGDVILPALDREKTGTFISRHRAVAVGGANSQHAPAIGWIISRGDRLFRIEDEFPAQGKFQLTVDVNFEAVDIRMDMRRHDAVWRERKELHLKITISMHTCYTKFTDL